MRIALVWLNSHSPVGYSHGLLILARELSDAGHEVNLLHLNENLGAPAEPGWLLDRLGAIDPEVIGFSFGSTHATEARKLIATASAGLRDKAILCGGIHATLSPEVVIAWEGVDAVGIGELDGGHLVEFINRLESGGPYENTRGFWVRKGETVHRNRLAPLPDLEKQPLPMLEILDLERLVVAKRGFGEVITGRGCPFRCRFCQNHALVERYRQGLGGGPASWPYCRQRRVADVIEEITMIRSRAPSVSAIMFADDRLAFDTDWLREFAGRYPVEIGLPFIANATVDQIDDETAELLNSAGCNMIKIGVECAPGPIRKNVLGRPFGEKRIRDAFNCLKKHEINSMAYLMVGIPGERKEDIMATFRFAAGLRPDAVRVAMFCPFEGTQIYADLAEKDMITDTWKVSGFLGKSVLKWDEDMAVLLDETIDMAPWLLNSYLEGTVGVASAKVVERIIKKGRSGILGNDLRAKIADFERMGVAYYWAPFPERPDWCFLRTRRRRPLINVESQEEEPS